MELFSIRIQRTFQLVSTLQNIKTNYKPLFFIYFLHNLNHTIWYGLQI